MPVVDFWFEFASPYSYVAAMRIETTAAAKDVTIRWRPFLLGPIFAAQGWNSSPFNLYPARGKHMWRDMARICSTLDLPFRRPSDFPQNSLIAARLALIGSAEGWIVPFAKAVYATEFGEGRDISRPDSLHAILNGLGLDANSLMTRARTDEAVKSRLRASTEEAQSIGIFGSPSFVTEDNEVFWGNDRLEAALDWASGAARRPG